MVFSRVLPLLLLPALAPTLSRAEDRWIALQSGPFEVFSNAGDRPAREKLMFLEQFRETLRVITGKAGDAAGLAGTRHPLQRRGRRTQRCSRWGATLA